MSFREKSAWISFFCILAVFGSYFAAVGGAKAGRIDATHLFPMFIAAVVILVVLEIVLHAAVAIRSPREATARRDERERLIVLKATRIAFYVLAVGAFLAIFTMHHGAGPRDMAHGVLLAFVLAELAKFGAEIVYFRRGT